MGQQTCFGILLRNIISRPGLKHGLESGRMNPGTVNRSSPLPSWATKYSEPLRKIAISHGATSFEILWLILKAAKKKGSTTSNRVWDYQHDLEKWICYLPFPSFLPEVWGSWNDVAEVEITTRCRNLLTKTGRTPQDADERTKRWRLVFLVRRMSLSLSLFKSSVCI